MICVLKLNKNRLVLGKRMGWNGRWLDSLLPLMRRQHDVMGRVSNRRFVLV
jgi:hypothetical protein